MKRLKARLRGTTPVGFGTRYVDETHGEMGIKERTSGIDWFTSGSDTEHNPLYSSPPISASNSTSSAPDSTSGSTNEAPFTLKKKKNSHKGRLVAVKLTPRKPATDTSPGMTRWEREEEEERTRVGFVREVEILKVCFYLFFRLLCGVCWGKGNNRGGGNSCTALYMRTSGDGFLSAGWGPVGRLPQAPFGGEKEGWDGWEMYGSGVHYVSQGSAHPCAVLVL
jgi:hypothetical protein